MLQINVIAHDSSRYPFTAKALKLLAKIKECNKHNIKLVIYFSNNSDLPLWKDESAKLIDNGISVQLVFPSTSTIEVTYLDKINYFVESDCEYSCSMDEDVLISNYLWDYIIENLNFLDDPLNLFLSPLISNGIPSVEMFINDFCTADDSNLMYEIFKNTIIHNFWGVDYSSLNYNKLNWNSEFYERVRGLDHYYKGIHPMRISVDAHLLMADIICNNIDRMLSPQSYYIEPHKFPYYCNSFYFIKTSIWKSIVRDFSLFRDNYDEVPLNLYREKYNMNMGFIRNGFCIHMAYNTIGENTQRKIEKYYIDNIP